MQVCLFVMVFTAAVFETNAQNFTGVSNGTYSESQVGFSVRKAATADGFTMPASPFNLLFQDVLLNDGDGWMVESGEFIAPVNGAYFFAFHAMSPKLSDFTMALMWNGSYKVTAYAPKGYNMAGNSALLKLDAGDSVSLQIQDGEIYENPLYETYTTFVGYRVY